MKGYHLAPLISLAVYGAAYFVSLYFWLYAFSSKTIPERFRVKTSPVWIWIILIASFAIPGVIAGAAFRIGGIMERGQGIAWGCYIETFVLGSLFFWLMGLVVTGILLAISLIIPQKLGFNNRVKPFLIFIIHNFHTIILISIMSWLIPKLSGPLNGLGASCL